MYLIVGLGNPEPEYSKTRHNMGFDVINKLAKQYEIELSRSNFEGIYGTGIIENEKVILLKPQTYMNLSGQSIKKYIDFYKIPLENILVVFDDMDTEKGKIKIRKMGGPGTHNGAKSVVHELQSEQFARILPTKLPAGSAGLPEAVHGRIFHRIRNGLPWVKHWHTSNGSPTKAP